MLVSLENAGIQRSERWLVRGISMSVEAGEIVTLIGPNGSGKSTTAKTALGILQPDEGSARQKPNLRTSYVPQKLEVNWTLPLTVRRFLRLTNPATDQQMKAALSATDTLHLEASQMSKLSGASFSVSFLPAPSCARRNFVLDEPVQAWTTMANCRSTG